VAESAVAWADVLARSRRCVELFVLRARRVAAHSLGADRDQLLEWASGTLHVEQVCGSAKVTVRRTYPPEESLESAAARIRPFILQNDAIYHAKVMGALGALLRGHEQPSTVVRDLRREWKAGDPALTKVRGLCVQQQNTDTGESTAYVSDSELALAWIYGDSIHLDERRLHQVHPFDVDDRYHAAAQLVANLMVLTISTLNFIGIQTNSGTLDLPASVFIDQVLASGTETTETGVLRVAPVDTPPPSIDEPWPSEWQTFDTSAHGPTTSPET
jgi:hypothetical protein